MSAVLTEEQKKRIEANKLRALQIRAQKACQPSQNVVPVTKNNQTSSSAPNSVQKCNIQTKLFNKPLSTSNQITNDTKSFYSASTSRNNSGSSASTNNVHTNKIEDFKKSFDIMKSSSGVISGTCVLTGEDKFTVVVPYCQPLINSFQTIDGRIYDAKTKNWSFPLKEYKKVMDKVSSMKSIVTLGSIPQPVLKLFSSKNSNEKQDYTDIDISKISETLRCSLYPFQREGIQFGISKNGRCIIADDMGLGKTIQALGISDYYKDDWPLLVMCPASMRYQWDEEIRTHLPHVPPSSIYVINSSKDEIVNPKVVITSYDLMSKMSKELKQIRFKMVIADESHFLKSIKANRTKVAVELIKSANRCLLLSGTPALSRPFELYTQINAIDPKFFPNMVEFGIRYCGGKKTHFGWDYSGSTNMEELKIILEKKFMIRRLKSDVLKQLPAKIRQVISLQSDLIDKSDKKLKSFEKKLDDVSIKGVERRGFLLAYYHETGLAKIKAICEYIITLLEQNKKFLLFAHHQHVLDAVCKVLEEKETFYIRIDGSVGSEERKSVVDQFQYEDKFRVAVLSITAANSGITLTAANLIVFVELFWNPGILMQAEDRAHRIGQQDSVLVQYLVAKNTADDHLWPLVQSKLDVLNKAGLSKDNFKSADTTLHHLKSSKQRSITDFFMDLDETADLLNSVMDDFEGKAPEKKPKLST